MSDRAPHTCIYCGLADGGCYRDIGTDGFYWCHQSCREGINPNRATAEYAAHAAAHDAALAEADREIESGKDLERGVEILIRTARVHEERADVALRQALLELHTMELARAEQVARAESAEAQLAHARADGARSMVEWLQQFDGIAGAELEASDAVLAAWQAHETETEA